MARKDVWHEQRIPHTFAALGACLFVAPQAWTAQTPEPRPNSEPRIIHITPTGNDTASGEDAAHPLATPRAARDRLRTLRAAQDNAPPAPFIIEFAPGTYHLSEPLTLDPQDSGAETSPIIYRAAPGAQVILSGGDTLPPWHAAKLDNRECWATECRPPSPLHELWVDGHRRMEARQPNTGFFKIENVPDVPKGTPYNKGFPHFRFRTEDAPIWQSVSPGTEVWAFTRWISVRMHVEKIDSDTRTARFDRPAPYLLEPGDLYVLKGNRAFLDASGEWWHDEPAGVLYYIPMPSESLDQSRAVIPRLTELLRITGDIEHANPVHDITFEGLTFSHATWWFPPDPPTSPAPDSPKVPLCARQAASGVAAAIHADGARRIQFNNCTIAHVGGYGLALARACADNSLSHCTLTDLGAGGIKIGEPVIRESDRTERNTVADCTITDGGHLQPEGVGIWIGQSEHSTVEHCRIADFLYSGISIGWTWGYGPARAGGNIIRFNDIGPIGTHPDNRASPPIGDMGGIYTLGAQPGTVITHNYFHDIRGRTITWGIYFDEGTTGATADHNVVVGTSHGSFHQHYGKENTLRNNLFIDPGMAILWRKRAEAHHSFTIADNVIVVPPDGAAFRNTWTDDHFTLRANTYLYTDKPPAFPANQTLEQWQSAGRDAGSIVEKITPNIANDPAALLRRYKDKLGDIDLSTIGPRK